ncbi:DUF1176 domain-containing protein [Escherichia coli]
MLFLKLLGVNMPSCAIAFSSLFRFVADVCFGVGGTSATGVFDWQVTCNNQNFCVARNTGDHNGLVMTLSRQHGAHTDAVLRIEHSRLGASPDASEGKCSRLLLDGEPLALSGDKWRISPWLLVTDDTHPSPSFADDSGRGRRSPYATAIRPFL